MEPGDLSKKDLVRLIELIAKCLDSENAPPQSDLIFEDFHGLIPFDKAVAFRGCIKNSRLNSIDQVFNHNYDDEWLDLYQKENFELIDPVIQFAVNNHQNAIEWNEAYDRTENPDRDFLNKSTDFGLKNGLAILLKGKTLNSNNYTGISLNIEDQLETHHKTILENIAPHIQSVFEKPSKEEIPELTKKEKETLYWVKEGKSSWEIGMILKISERTVKFHLSNIFVKLDVVNRSQAVAKALQFGLVNL